MERIETKLAAGLFIAGAMVGAGVALLCAPQSGTRTRRDIGRFARMTADRFDDMQEDVRGRVTDWVDDVTEAVTNGVDRGRKVGAEGFDKVLHAFDSVKTCVEDGKARVEHLRRKESA